MKQSELLFNCKESDWIGYFPYEKVRKEQSTIINFAINSFRAGKKYVIIEAGTGIGKSAVGVTVGRYFSKNRIQTLDTDPEADYNSGTWFVTTQKLLQSQYEDDFGGCGKNKMKSIKSSTNYSCKFHKKNTCAESQQLLKIEEKGTPFFKTCVFSCKYKEDKKKFIESLESVTNFPYLLTEANYSGKITPRNLLVVDECHNTESELSKFIEISVSERFAKHALKLSFPKQTTQLKAIKWIREVYFPKASSQLAFVESQIEKLGDRFREKIKEFKSINRQHDLLRGHVGKIKKFLELYDKDNWVFELVPSFNKSMRKFSFKPLDVAPYANDSLFRLGDRVLMLSATILNKDAFCKELGINIDEIAFISVDSPFPKENRPIIPVGVGNMSMKHIDKTLPRMVEAVKSILEEHKNEKGVIHTHTYKIAKYLKENVKDSRLLLHTSENRDETLRKHRDSKKATVLLSPSMTEGVDLKDELSRFQILMKVPYPYLGSPLIKKKMNKYDWYYGYATAKTVVQAVGRSVRNENDIAVTYILDQGWDWFFQKNKEFFSSDFKQCVIS
jgi:ATP-dependent DNA helicase DinG